MSKESMDERFDKKFLKLKLMSENDIDGVAFGDYDLPDDIKAFLRKELADQKARAIEIAKTIRFPNSGETVATVLEEKL